ncbi:hypothetical protein ABS642_01035 [Microbacterium sp. A8/3-1]|uniref:Uncharacterized protein n=1 Tax=Microbacterium sp. A8/3-1 TaxID=3160749 RepID=A0AAU7VWA4_9MICO
MTLLDDVLRVSPTTRKAYLRNLSDAQRTQLQSEMTARQKELGITPPPTTKSATAPAAPKINQDRYNSVRSGSFVGGKVAVRLGQHLVLLAPAMRYKKTRETLMYTYYQGVVGGYQARGSRLVALKIPPESRAHIARTMFNVKNI